MDPNQWAYNQAYRLNTGLPANTRFDIPLIDQSPAGSQGLGALPAHTSLAQPRALGALPTMNYAGHHAMGVSQLLDTLGTSLAASQTPYKTVSVGQPAYTLESPVRTLESRIPVGPNPVSTANLSQKWDISSFVPASMGAPFSVSGLSQDSVLSGVFPGATLEPPPAHSRNPPSARASTIQRNPYQKDFSQPPLHPVTAHSGVSRGNQVIPSYSPLPAEREPPVAHSHNQFSAFVTSESSIQSRSHSSQSINSGIRNPPISQHSYPNSPQLQQTPSQQRSQETYSYSRGLNSNNFVNSKMSGISTSPPLSYEAVSPANNQLSDSQTSDFNMSLADLADISSNQQKLPLQQRMRQQQEQQQQQHQQHQQQQHLHNNPTTWASSPHSMPLGKLNRREQNQGMSSPPSHNMVGGSPMHQPSPSNHGNVGSPQVGMPLGSPHTASSNVSQPQLPIQAVPDSTTKPKTKRSRKRKEKTEVPQSLQQQPPSLSQQNFPSPSPVPMPQYTDLSSFNVGTGASVFPSSQPEYTTIDYQTHAALTGGTPPQPPQETVFMTNAFGNAFINPHDAMVQDEKQMMQELNPKPQLQQHNPRPQEEMVDDEFAHLVTPQPQSQPPPPAKPEKKDTAFQNSFMSFLQGNKGETLSQVTNSNVPKPTLPKYIPDPRPVVPLESRVKEEPPPRKRPQITFSDDDDESQGKFSKTVKNVLTNLSDEEEGWAGRMMGTVKRGRTRGPLGKPRSRGPRGGFPKKRQASWENEDEAELTPPTLDIEEQELSGVPPVVRKQREPSPVIPRERTSRRAKEKIEEKRKIKKEKKASRKSSGVYVSESDISSSEEEVAPIEKDYDSDKDPAWNPTAIPDFQMPVRHDSDNEGGAEGSLLRQRGKSRGKKIRITPSKTGRSRGGARLAGQPYRERSRSPPSVRREESGGKAEEHPPMGPSPVPEPVHLPSDDDDEEPVHRFMKGDFVLEKKDIANYDSYPIWKIDAGRLIQKFEPCLKDGKMIHKSMSTYSSWSDSIRHQFKAIKVRIIQLGRGQIQEQVEVLELFRPQPPETNEDEEEELMPSFNIYMQILISQALEPGFLAAINEEKDEYYHGPLQAVQDVVEESRIKLEAKISTQWRAAFKEHVDLYPECKVFERPNTSTLCQATPGPGIPSSQAVVLSGEAYDRETLEPRASLAPLKKEYMCNAGTVRLLPLYHKLQHYRLAAYQSCLSKVCSMREANKDLENRDILDQCLQNRAWVQKIFRELKLLVKETNEKT